jgi:uncharacterized SAM-binding protein YcdF (DUF218 family)
MNDLLMAAGLSSWKSLLAVLILPPVPFLVMVLVGARLMFRRRLLAWGLILLACIGLWFSASAAGGKLLRQTVHPVPPALSQAQIQALRPGAEPAPRTAIVVLGGGQRALAPEYGLSNLTPLSIERLRYGLWLGRQTRLPVLFSGGPGYGEQVGATEAETAARIAEREFGQPLKWTEDRSRDTVENGMLTAEILEAEQIRRIVLVSHDFHMKRATRAFVRGAARAGIALEILPAPVDVTPLYEWRWQDFVPTRNGHYDTQLMLHEWLGYLAGA